MKSFHEVGISYDELLATSSDLIQVITPEGQILYANPQWLYHLGYEESSLSEMNFFTDVVEIPFETNFISQVKRLSPKQHRVNVHGILKSLKNDDVVVDGYLIGRFDGDELVTITCIFHDVSARDGTDAELERMFAMSVDMLGIVDFDGIFVRLNPSWEQVLGYPLDELLGKPFLSFVHPDDLERTIEESAKSQSSSTTEQFENRYLCKDGSVKWISWHYISYPQHERIYFVARDITSARENKTLLIEARDQLQGILDNSGTLIGLKNWHGEYMLVNQEFADVFGDGDKASLLGKRDEDIFPEAAVNEMQLNSEKTIESRTARQFEETIVIDETARTYLTTRFVLRDKDNEPYGICMIAKDITYRKLTEIQLLMRNQAIEHSPSGISIADATLDDMPLIYINPAFEKTTGYSALDSIGRNCRFLQGDDRDQDGVRELRHAIQNEEAVTVVIRNYHKDGTLFYNELSIAPIHNKEGKLTHYVGISTDVTSRVESEEKIQHQNDQLRETNHHLALARQEAEDATKKIQVQNAALMNANRDLAYARKQAEDATTLKSQFLATMSHELRTPLNAIIGYTEIQLAGMTGEITEEQRDYQERVLTNADHLLNLINDVLDISKIEAGRLELVNKVFNLRDWVQDVDNQTRVLAEEKALKFTVDVDNRMPEKLVGDPARVKQVVINLLSNGMKFTEDGHVRLSIRKHGRDAWKILVTDSGIGIPPHMQETIFEEFRQVDSSSRRKVGGTGLGLAIVRKLTLMMGGTIRLSSQLGEGSTFTIVLPLIEEVVPIHHKGEREKSDD